ncbi:MAG TPA: glycosyltransferase family 4 protein [Thermoanaerobaculia bacterium]|nr:glycosyltransferase family 4 protein [Thermoanaerobaculia bacterium]
MTSTGRPLRLLQLVTRRQLRGAEVFAAQLSEGLAALGCEVVLAGLYAPGEPPLAAAGVELLDLGGRPRRGLSPRLVRRLRRLVAARRPDLVQANGSDTLKYAVLALRGARPRPPLVYRSISIQSLWLRGALHRRWNRWLLHQADCVAAVSRGAAGDLVATHSLAPGRVTVLPLGTSAGPAPDPAVARARLAAAAGLDPTGPLLVHVGSFTPEKDHALLLAAFREVRRRLPAARLVLLGDGPLRPAVERRAAAAGWAASGTGGAVRFLGARPDAAELAGGADLLVLSSRIEGTPGVVLEAAARGVPAVATAVGGLPEVVEHGRTGLLTAPGDAAELAGALLELLAAPERRRAMGRSARERVLERHDLGLVTRSFLELYRRLDG